VTATTDALIAFAYVVWGFVRVLRSAWLLSDPKRDNEEAWWVR
jgi:hypothetical protein